MYNEFKKGFTLSRTRNRKHKIQATRHKQMNKLQVYVWICCTVRWVIHTWISYSLSDLWLVNWCCVSDWNPPQIHLCWLEPVQTINVLQKKCTRCSHDPFIKKCHQPLWCHINRLIVQLHTCCLQLKTQVKGVCLKTNLKQGYFLAEEYRDITSYLWSGGISIAEITLCKYPTCQSSAFKSSLEWKNVLWAKCIKSKRSHSAIKTVPFSIFLL